MADKKFRQFTSIFPSKIRVNNYKALVGLEFQFSPITVLLGANSSGKTSIIQSLLLMCSNVSQPHTGEFDFNSPLFALGTVPELLTRLSPKRQASEMSFGLDFELLGRHGSKNSEAGISFRLIRDRDSQFSRGMPISNYCLWEKIESTQTNLYLEKLSLKKGTSGNSESNLYKLFGSYTHDASGELNVNLPSALDFLGSSSSKGRKGSFNVEKIFAIAESRVSDRFLPAPIKDRPVYIVGDLIQSALEFGGLRLLREEINVAGKTRPNLKEIIALQHEMSAEIEVIRKFKLAEKSSDEKVIQLISALSAASESKDPLEVAKVIASHFLDNSIHLSRKKLKEYANALEEFRTNLPNPNKRHYLIFPLTIGPQKEKKYISALTLEAELRKYLSESVHYLGPLRAFSQSEQAYYPPISSLMPLGSKGESLAWVLGSDRMTEKDNFPVPPKQFDGEVELSYLSLGEALKSWIVWFGLGDGFSLEDEGSWGKFLVLDREKLNQKGTGISQVLPVVALCLLAKVDSLCMIEQPELHLHPSLQQKLGTFFAYMVKSGRRVLIETHSEYLVTRLRREVAVGKLQASDLSLSFISRGEGNQEFSPTTIHQVLVSKYGLVENWPEEYYDFTADDNLDIFEATYKD